MKTLQREELWSLEDYARVRGEFRYQVMAHKQRRQVCLGEHLRLLFEDRLTIQYQIQEMLRIERIFEAEGIQDELDAYNPLIPDGDNWKATLMIEYVDPPARQQALARLVGIERQVWVQVEGCDKVFAVADEDLTRETAEKTSSVHFLRFELTPEMRRGLQAGGGLRMGVDHPQYRALCVVEAPVRQALQADLAAPGMH